MQLCLTRHDRPAFCTLIHFFVLWYRWKRRRRDPTRIAHTGFPEISFEKYTNKLTASGHQYVTLV